MSHLKLVEALILPEPLEFRNPENPEQGAAAEAARNTFYYLTYDGAVDLDAIKEDPHLMKATQDQITYFGQTPGQLLIHPHPQRCGLK
eukprot:3505283-Pyramimonas_sp.AAC.1